MQEYSLTFAFSKDQEHIALIKKNRPDWQKNKYNGIGGKINPGESALDGAVREFKEETGVELISSALNHFAVMVNESSTWKVHCFKIFTQDVWKIDQKTDEEVRVFSVNTVLRHLYKGMMLPNLKQLMLLALDEEIDLTTMIYKD